MEHKFVRITCETCGHNFCVPLYCGDRFCAVCSVSRNIRIQKRLKFLVSSVERRTGYNFKHLTLTIKNQKNLALMTATIVKCFRELRSTSSWKTHVCGGAYVVEITGDSSNWHVHLHIIIQSIYYPFLEILKLWKVLSPGQGVYIQNIPKDQIVKYLSKYLSKTNISSDNRYELSQALKGSRLFQAFGIWFALTKKFKNPPTTCPGCDEPSFVLYGEIFSNCDSFIWKKV